MSSRPLTRLSEHLLTMPALCMFLIFTPKRLPASVAPRLPIAFLLVSLREEKPIAVIMMGKPYNDTTHISRSMSDTVSFLGFYFLLHDHIKLSKTTCKTIHFGGIRKNLRDILSVLCRIIPIITKGARIPWPRSQGIYPLLAMSRCRRSSILSLSLWVSLLLSRTPNS